MRREQIAWAGLAAMTVSFGLNFSVGVFFAPTAASYGVSATALALAAALGTTVTGLAQPLVGGLLDRVGAKRVLIGGLTLISASYLVLAVVRTTWEFLTVYVLLGGIGFASSSTLTVTTLIGRTLANQVGPALTRAAVGINLGQLTAPWVATALFEPVGVRVTYALLGGVGLVVTGVLWWVLPVDHIAGVARRAESLAGRGRVLISFGLHSATLYVVILMLPEHAVETDWSIAAAGRLVAVAALAAGLTSAAMARLQRWYRPEVLLQILYGMRIVALALAVCVPGPSVLIAVAAVFGAASFPVIPLTMAIMSRGLDPARMGRTLAPAWVIHQLAAAAGLAVASGIHARTDSYRGYFALGMAFSIAAARLVAPVRKPRTELVISTA
ncbi:MFS transporter [Nocardia sp. NPDC051787]|uniref:MFS transporter n=1 Tax=Nocardia sp. NPDC051787 TaxID=3155415 RepID=UPI00343206AB